MCTLVDLDHLVWNTLIGTLLLTVIATDSGTTTGEGGGGPGGDWNSPAKMDWSCNLSRIDFFSLRRGDGGGTSNAHQECCSKQSIPWLRSLQFLLKIFYICIKKYMPLWKWMHSHYKLKSINIGCRCHRTHRLWNLGKPPMPNLMLGNPRKTSWEQQPTLKKI